MGWLRVKPTDSLAFLNFCGFTAVVFQGAAAEWKYLYAYDGGAELRDAAHSRGKDTWETEDVIKEELGQSEHKMSVFSIGPAGENLVGYAAIGRRPRARGGA